MNTYLVIDDDTVLRERLIKSLIARGAHALGAANLEEGLSLARRHRPQRVILDLRLPDGLGTSAIAGLRAELAPEAEILMLTGFGAVPTALAAVRAGAVNFLTKPATVDEILRGFHPTTDSASANTTECNPPSLEEVERNHIDRVMQTCGGNITKAAEALGIHRRSLQRKLSKIS